MIKWSTIAKILLFPSSAIDSGINVCAKSLPVDNKQNREVRVFGGGGRRDDNEIWMKTKIWVARQRWPRNESTTRTIQPQLQLFHCPSFTLPPPCFWPHKVTWEKQNKNSSYAASRTGSDLNFGNSPRGWNSWWRSNNWEYLSTWLCCPD